MNGTLLERDVFGHFVKPGEVTEVRAFISGKHLAWGNEYSKGIVSGYFDCHASFCDSIRALDKLPHEGIYFTLQVIDPRLLARAFNRLAVLKTTTSDRDVIAYRWLPIDLDPVRPAGISASDAELEAAISLRDEIAEKISSSYQLPPPVRAISGNGAHLLYRLPDLAAKDYSATVKSYLEEISQRFSNSAVHVDSKNFNPARIWKLFGTTARKGDPVPAGNGRPARPHRLAYIDGVPEWMHSKQS
jgi:hypothetical protein